MAQRTPDRYHQHEMYKVALLPPAT